MKRNKIVIGTRGSKLALWQAEWVRSELLRIDPSLNVELNRIKTTGDKIIDVPLAKVGGKGLFVKEIEEALLHGSADIAVHSMKDVPTEFPEGLHLGAICKREDPRDAFLTRRKNNAFQIPDFNALPRGATVGTSSLRRSCQLLHIRPDLKISQLRGNLDTRVRKLDEGLYDAIILAVAGVKRLGWTNRITDILSTDISLPAIGQGAVGIECRDDDQFINSLVGELNDEKSALCVKAERAFLKKLEGGCQVPIAAYAKIEHGALSKSRNADTAQSEVQMPNAGILVMDGLVGSVSGDHIIREHAEGNIEHFESIGIELASILLGKGAGKILQEVYGKSIGGVDLP
jgi:hydroxymethylbilane synthase